MKEMKFEIQRFDTDSGDESKKVAIEVLNVLGQIVINLGLKKLAEDLNNASNATEWLKNNVNPVLRFIGTTKFGKKFDDYSKLITNSISIIDNTLAIAKGGLSDADRTSKIGAISESLVAMADATNKLNRETLLNNDNDKLWFLSIVSGGISLVANLIAGMDGVTESDQEKINRSYIKFMRTLGSTLVKKIFDDAFEKNLSRAFTESVTDDLLADIFKKGKFFKEAAPVFLKTFNGIMIFGSGILNGYNKYKNNLEKYLDDGIPEDMAKHDAFIDAVAKFAKETMSGIVFGVDDLIFDVAKWITTSWFGIEYAEDENKDYIETLIYKTPLKNLNYTNTGLSTDDKILYVLENSTMVYGDDGNDSIDNFGFSNATIWGGHDNDTIHSYKTESATPQENSIFGGSGNDQIVVYDKLSTIYGGKDNDSIMVLGTNNAIYGNAGNDSIYVYIDANENVISGGTGDDKIILLEGTKNALIKYTEGDGNDTIYYFDEDDALKISGSYKISTNDKDVKIKVGNGSMLLVGAAGKNIKINGRTITNRDADDNILPAEMITLPTFPTMPETVESPFIYGTNVNDTIENHKDNVFISSDAGDDKIINSGDNCSIKSGVGNDYVINSGSNVTIDGGTGKDSVYTSNSSVVVYGGEDSDYLETGGEFVILYGGVGKDYIHSYGVTHVTIDGGDDDDYIRYSNDGICSQDYINGKSCYISISGNGGNDTIENTNINDYISEYREFIVDGGTGDDKINIFGGRTTVNAGDGNDTVFVNNDIFSYGNILINGETGNDYVSINSYFMDNFITVNGGQGDDTIDSPRSVIIYQKGDGNDVVYYHSNGLIIQDVPYEEVIVDNDVILKIGEGSVTLKNVGDAKYKNFITGKSNSPITLTVSNNDDTINDLYKYEYSDFFVAALEGDDYVHNYNCKNSMTLDGGDGNDTIDNYDNGYNHNKICGGNGNDFIYNSGKDTTIDGGADNDTIRNTGVKVTINGGAGDDYISLDSYNSYYNLINYTKGDGNDIVYGLNYGDTLKITGGEYSTVKSGNDIKIIVGDGSILVKDKSSINFTIDGTLGGDVNNTKLITGTSGADFIYNALEGATINALGSNDTIQNGEYANPLGSKSSINAGTGADYIKNYAEKVTINGYDGNDSILNGGNGVDGYYVYIDGGADNDSISNYGFYVTMSGGSGNDKLYNGAHYATMNGGDGDDSVYNAGSDVIIDVGSGDDTISIFNAYSTIIGGTGEDFISLGSYSYQSLIKYQDGDGKDIIFGLNSDDTLKITGSEYSTVKSGNDMKIIVGDGSIWVKDKSSIDFTIDGTLGSGIDTTLTDTLPAGISVKNSVVTASTLFSGSKIDLADYSNANKVDVSALSQGVSIIGSSSANSIKGGSGADTISGGYGNDTVSLGGGSDVYIYSSGNDLIQDYTSGQDKIKLSSGSISSASVSNDNVILNVSNGGKITIQNAKDKEITFIDSNGKEFKEVYHSDDNPEPNDNLPTGMSVKSSVVTATNKFTGNKIDLSDYPVAIKVDASAVSQALNIIGDSSDNSIKGGKGSDTINGGSGNDTLVGGTGKDLFVYSSGNDLITDYKPNEDKIKLNLSAITSSSVKGSDVILTTFNGTLTVKGTKDKAITFVDNNGKTSERIFFGDTSYEPLETGLAYDAKRVVLTASNKFTDNTINLDEYLPTVTKLNASATSQNISIVGNASDNSIKGGKGADTINGGRGKDTILGGAGNDSIYGGNDNDKLQGDAGNDTLNGGFGNDTLIGNAGNDVFVYDSGNDIITDYKPNEDKIRLNLSAITKSSVKGSDVILTTSNGSLTIKATKDKVITFVDNDGKTSERIFFGDTSYEPLKTGVTYDAKRVVLTASNKFTDSTINLDEYLPTVTKLNASATSQNINIVGNASDNSIKGGKGADTISGGNGKDTIFGGIGNDSIYGGNDNDKLQGDAGNDTLNGGTGNDTLTGNAGNDVFVYEGGNDFITDYKPNEDKIRLNLSAITSSSVKGSDVILTTFNGTLTVKGTKDKIITFVDNNGKTSERIFFANTSYAPLETGLAYDAKRVVLTASNEFIGNKIDLGEYLGTVTKLNSSATSQNVNIIGNSADNSIKAGKGADTISGGNGKDTIFGGADNDSLYGGNDNDILNGEAGNDTLNGGSGNNTLTGGAGNDVFIYEGGNDVITDYTAGQDSIKVSGTISNVSYNGKNVVFSIGNGSLIVNNAKGKDITVTNNNNQTQTYSKTLDLLYDNNFVADEFALDDISEVTETNYSVGKLEYSSNNNELANNSIVSAFSFDEK